jgi:hypothetical protein
MYDKSKIKEGMFVFSHSTAVYLLILAYALFLHEFWFSIHSFIHIGMHIPQISWTAYYVPGIALSYEM